MYQFYSYCATVKTLKSSKEVLEALKILVRITFNIPCTDYIINSVDKGYEHHTCGKIVATTSEHLKVENI